MKELATALAKAQAMMKPALKDTANPFFKTKYADLTSIWDACRDALTKNGLSVVQTTDFDQAGAMWITTTLLHSSGEKVEGRYPIKPVQATPQGVGSAITYARRYALAAMVGVVADVDDDGHAASANGKAEVEPWHNTAADFGKPPAQTMVGRKNEAKGISEAREWVNTAIAHLGKITTTAKLDAFVEKNSETMEKISGIVPEEYAALAKRIDEAAARLNELVS